MHSLPLEIKYIFVGVLNMPSDCMKMEGFFLNIVYYVVPNAYNDVWDISNNVQLRSAEQEK